MKRISRESAINTLKHHSYIMDYSKITIKEALEYLRLGNTVLLKNGAKLLKNGRFYYIYGYAVDKSDLVF